MTNAIRFGYITPAESELPFQAKLGHYLDSLIVMKTVLLEYTIEEARRRYRNRDERIDLALAHAHGLFIARGVATRV